MKQTLRFLSLVLLSCIQVSAGFSQIISQFTWDSGSVLTAAIGPDAIGASASAMSDVGGVGGTNGLNAGLPKADVGLIMVGTPTFDVAGIDVSFDYQKEENAGTFWMRGNSLVINGCANLSVSYRVDDGAGGFNTINSGNVYVIPEDDIYRTYRFYYIPTTGVGELSVNGVVVWTNDGPDNRNMYWLGSGNVNIASGMDGTGNDDTFMDNLTVGEIFSSPLPIELISFNVTKKNNKEALVTWISASESQNDFYTIERSTDGISWLEIGKIDGAGNSSEALNYEFTDAKPYMGTNYYRLRQTDFDGTDEVFDPKKLVFTGSSNVDIYPNPTNDLVNIQFKEAISPNIQVFNSLGQEMTNEVITSEIKSNSVQLSLVNLPSGVYFIKVGAGVTRIIKKG